MDQFFCGRAHGVIEGDLYIGALFSIHDQVREGGNFAETPLRLFCWQSHMLQPSSSSSQQQSESGASVKCGDIRWDILRINFRYFHICHIVALFAVFLLMYANLKGAESKFLQFKMSLMDDWLKICSRKCKYVNCDENVLCVPLLVTRLWMSF